MTITAVWNDSPTSPGFDISLSGLTGSSYYKVVRVDLTGFLPDDDVRIPGANPDGLVTLIANTAAVSDYEFSFNTNIQYKLQKYNASKVLTTTETTTPGFAPLPTTAYYGHAWLKDVFTPTNSRAIIIGEFTGYNRSGRVRTFDIL